MLLVSAVAGLLGACAAPQGAFPVDLLSAEIETRQGPSAAELSEPTRVIVLGTGTPIPDARRAGASIAIIHKGEAYLFDVGAGSIRNATVARYKYDIPSLYPSQICCVFITHMHSDHTLDFPELAYTMWWRRRAGLLSWGPTGMVRMVRGLTEMMGPDTDVRTRGSQPLPNPTGNVVTVIEIEEGIVFKKDDLVVEAFKVNHGNIKPAFGYKITTADKSIVISGDTAYSETLAEKAKGVDLLFHEVISELGLMKNSPFWQNYHKNAHTTSVDVGRIASKAQPKKLVLYHGLYYGTPEASVIDEVKSVFEGEVILANDLDVF